MGEDSYFIFLAGEHCYGPTPCGTCTALLGRLLPSSMQLLTGILLHANVLFCAVRLVTVPLSARKLRCCSRLCLEDRNVIRGVSSVCNSGFLLLAVLAQCCRIQASSSKPSVL